MRNRPLRYREDDTSSRGMMFLAAGAIAGVAAGVWLAQRLGGFSAISERVRERFGHGDDRAVRGSHVADTDLDTLDADESEELEERVLEAFRNDPILGERAVDIGAIGTGIIELTGWVHDEDEADHAVTLTRGTPGVTTVVNRLSVRSEEEEYAESARRYESGDPALTEAHWEGQQVGIGRRRQGTSAEADRHADPKPKLEDRWMDTHHATMAAAEDTDGIAERRKQGKKAIEGDRTGGAPVAPTGVPKSDHVADPDSAHDILRESSGRETRRAD